MKRLILISLLLLGHVFANASGHSVPQARVAGLEADSTYMDLIHSELQLQQVEDSLAGVLSDTRALLRSEPERRAVHGEQILRLESELFDLRSRIGLLSGRINAIEQRYVMDNLLNISSIDAPSTMHDYLRAELSAEEYADWQRADGYEGPVYDFVRTYLANYLNIRQIASQYDTVAAQPQADSLYTRYSELRRFAGVMSDTVATLWSYVYDTKGYLCNLLMERAGDRVYLTRLQERLMQLEGAKAALLDDIDSESIGLYVPEKQFVITSELAIAESLGDGRTADSLRTRLQVFDGMMSLPAIVLQPKTFEPPPPKVDARGRPVKPAAKPATAAKPVAYRLEIASRATTLPTNVSELLGEVEISRAASADAGGALYTFIVVVAQGEGRANELAAAIRNTEPTLIVQVTPVR